MTNGIDPYRTLQDVSLRLDSLTDPGEIETALDEVEYLFEVIPPEIQDLAELIINALRKKLSEFP
jgi:capsid portal protein